MSTGMLGKLSLPDVQGPRDALEQHLAGPDGPLWLAELKKYLRKEPTWQKETDARSSSPTLVLVKTTSLAGGMGKKTRDCFTGELWAYRDEDIDGWLPQEQAAQAAGTVGVYLLQNPEGTTFREMALVATQQATPEASNDKLAAMLKGRGLTLTLLEIEAMVERQESGENIGLRADGYSNFAFVEDANDGVSVLYFRRHGRGWHAFVYRLARGPRWHVGPRFLLRNSDTSAL